MCVSVCAQHTCTASLTHSCCRVKCKSQDSSKREDGCIHICMQQDHRPVSLSAATVMRCKQYRAWSRQAIMYARTTTASILCMCILIGPICDSFYMVPSIVLNLPGSLSLGSTYIKATSVASSLVSTKFAGCHCAHDMALASQDRQAV